MQDMETKGANESKERKKERKTITRKEERQKKEKCDRRKLRGRKIHTAGLCSSLCSGYLHGILFKNHPFWAALAGKRS